MSDKLVELSHAIIRKLRTTQKLALPNPPATPTPSLEDIEAAYDQPWMANALDEYDQLSHSLLDLYHPLRHLSLQVLSAGLSFAGLGMSAALKAWRPTSSPIPSQRTALSTLYSAVNHMETIIADEIAHSANESSPAPNDKEQQLIARRAELQAQVHSRQELGKRMLIHSMTLMHALWEAIPRDQLEGIRHPFAPLIEAWLLRQCEIKQRPENAKALTINGLARTPNHMKTAALAPWESIPDARVIEVDGEPVSSPYHYRPKRPLNSDPNSLPLQIPGTRAAMDLRLAMLRHIEQHAHIDRRSPLPNDTLYFMTLSAALIHPLIIHVDNVGAMMASHFSASGATPKQKKSWRDRAWPAIAWSSMDIKLPSGHWMPIVRVDRGGDLPEGVIRIWPYEWPEGTTKGFRLTGALTGQITRYDRKGSFPRLIAGIEDYIGSSNHLRQPVRPGGPGQTSEFLSYPALFARAGFHFDLTDKKDYNATASLWSRLQNKIEENGYRLASLRAEAEAGDTVEVVDIVKGQPKSGGMGGLIVRASARYIEAHERFKRKRSKALDAVPLSTLFRHDL